MVAPHSGPYAESRSGQFRYSDRPGFDPFRRPRALLAVGLVHLLMIWVVLHGLAGGSVAPDRGEVMATLLTYSVVATPPQPQPKPMQQPSGAKAPPAKRAQATSIAAPKRTILIPPRVIAAPVAGVGSASRSGVESAGSGSGAGGLGQGTGRGESGSGAGGGIAEKAIKISGDINSVRDYPPDPGMTRLGSSVIVALTVQIDGRVGACRVVRASVDPQADAVTCRLAVQRFRFRPAINAAGQPAESTYGWKQSWFKPDASTR